MLVYNGASKELFHQSLDIFQYSAGIEMTWITRGKLSGKFFQEILIWVRKFCLFFQLIKEKLSVYHFQLISENNIIYTTRSVRKDQIFSSKTKKKYFSKILSFLQL